MRRENVAAELNVAGCLQVAVLVEGGALLANPAFRRRRLECQPAIDIADAKRGHLRFDGVLQ